MKYKSRKISSKWLKTQWLLGDEELLDYVPDTRSFSEANLNAMLGEYDTLYMKPFHGYGGRGIMRIKKLPNNTFEMHRDQHVYAYSSMNSLYKHLRSYAYKKKHLLQKGIELKRSAGRPFDLRIMVQKDRKGVWHSTGIFAKLGRAGKVVNNYQQGGRISFLPGTLKNAGFSQDTQEAMEQHLGKLGEQVGRCFDKHRTGFRELGLDVAIDKQNRFWILEVNTSPSYYPLKNMKNKEMYHRIAEYAKQYGRRS